MDSMAQQCRADAQQDRGAIVFDYGNNIRKQASTPGAKTL